MLRTAAGDGSLTFERLLEQLSPRRSEGPPLSPRRAGTLLGGTRDGDRLDRADTLAARDARARSQLAASCTSWTADGKSNTQRLRSCYCGHQGQYFWDEITPNRLPSAGADPAVSQNAPGGRATQATDRPVDSAQVKCRQMLKCA